MNNMKEEKLNNSKIKVSERFFSFQGEGLHTGVPSVFLRTFGCNFQCNNFGLPLNTPKVEAAKQRNEIAANINQYKTYNELPLVTVGCDSYAAWDSRFKHLSPMMECNDIADEIVNLLPHKRWEGEHLVITGGEPLLGWQRSYPALLDNVKMRSLKHLTFETNGTQKLTDEFKHYLLDWCLDSDDGMNTNPRNYRSITFSVSPKLSVSGESWGNAIKPEIVASYERVGYTYLKFVVASLEDVKEAELAVKEYRETGFWGSVYLMPVGGVEDVFNMNKRRVADLALERGWRYSDRLQVNLYQNQWGT